MNQAIASIYEIGEPLACTTGRRFHQFNKRIPVIPECQSDEMADLVW
jgi:hypothetical protein